MTNTEKIRKEIERRIGAMYNFSSGYSALNTCRELLDFIDKLPKETVTDCHQLDMQTFAKEMSDNIFTLPSSETKNTEESPLQWEYTIARHFAKWGAEHLKK